MKRFNDNVFLLCLFTISVVTFSGCGPTLNSQQSIDLGGTEMRTILVAPTGGEQEISVSAKAAGAKINVYVFLSENGNAADQAIMANSESDVIIASQKDSSDIQLKALIPANKEASVLLMSATGKGTKVELSISN